MFADAAEDELLELDDEEAVLEPEALPAEVADAPPAEPEDPALPLAALPVALAPDDPETTVAPAEFVVATTPPPTMVVELSALTETY